MDFLKPEKIGEYEAGVIEQELKGLLGHQGAKLAMDFSTVQTIASAGLGLLLMLNRYCRSRKGAMVVFGLNASLQAVFSMTHVGTDFKIVKSQDDALKALA